MKQSVHALVVLLAAVVGAYSAGGCASGRAGERGPAGLLPVELRCESREAPLGVEVPAPRLSWQLVARDAEQRSPERSCARSSSTSALTPSHHGLPPPARRPSSTSPGRRLSLLLRTGPDGAGPGLRRPGQENSPPPAPFSRPGARVTPRKTPPRARPRPPPDARHRRSGCRKGAAQEVMRLNRLSPRSPFVSLATRFVASLWNTTKRPSDEIEAEELWLFPCAPPVATLTSSVETAPSSSNTPSLSMSRSRSKTSSNPFVSLATRFEALLKNTTKRPSAEIEG